MFSDPLMVITISETIFYEPDFKAVNSIDID